MNNISCVLTIAGTDPSGGAGIHADLKTFQELKSYGMSVITSVVAQNTTGVQAVHHLPIEMITQQLDSILSDMPVHSYKTGMIASVDMMKAIKEKITNLDVPFVLDPVMVATSGDALIDANARSYLREHLLPLATIVTPNIPEAEFITGGSIKTIADMQDAANQIVHDYGAGAALIKGGHLTGEAIDILYDGEKMYTFTAERIHTKNTHGTGCTYSAAITAYLGQGATLPIAVEKSKHFITNAIQHAFPLGNGNGPTNHFAARMGGVKQ